MRRSELQNIQNILKASLQKRVMISPKVGVIILLVLPILPLTMAIIFNHTKKQKSFEFLFLLSIINSILFFYAYGTLLEFPFTDKEKIYYSDFWGQLFLLCVGNILIPVTYLILLAGFYFVFYKFRRR
jgi:hypothetical protein